MVSYTARVANPAGRVRRLTLDAGSEAQAWATLADRGLVAVAIAESTSRVRSKRVRRGGEIAVARQIASLLEAGVTLDAALSITLEASADPVLRSALETVRASIRGGSSLYHAFSQSGQVIPPIGIGMIAAGERSGSLAPAFDRLASYLETRDRQRQQLLAALSYPIFLVLAGLAATAVLVVLVIPRFSDMLVAADAALPASTAVLLGAGDLAARWWFPFFTAALLLTGAAALVLRRPRTKRAMHVLLLRAPALGPARRSSAAVHVGQALSSLLAEGVPVVHALGSTGETVTDLAVRESLLAAADHVRSGASLSGALRRTASFPTAFVEMIAVGERSARVPELMHRAALIEDDRLNRHVQRLIRFAEPAMIVGFGGFIGFVALALLQAVYGIHGGVTP